MLETKKKHVLPTYVFRFSKHCCWALKFCSRTQARLREVKIKTKILPIKSNNDKINVKHGKNTLDNCVQLQSVAAAICLGYPNRLVKGALWCLLCVWTGVVLVIPTLF